MVGHVRGALHSGRMKESATQQKHSSAGLGVEPAAEQSSCHDGRQVFRPRLLANNLIALPPHKSRLCQEPGPVTQLGA